MANKPFYESLKEMPWQSFLWRRVIRKERPNLKSAGVWHFHPDYYEITLTLKSSGKRFVGYNISDYSEYDLVLIGKQLPHCWITTQKTEQLVVNFKKEQLGDLFWKLPEMNQINDLLTNSNQGIFFDRNTATQAHVIMAKMEYLKGADKLFHLFQLLNLLACAKNQKSISFNHKEIKNSIKASNRIEKVYLFVLENYQSSAISFTKLCSELNMTKSSVCKFIKKVTKKSFSEILSETRINEACKLLAETDMFISEICFKCGFNNLSNFNRSFKKLMILTPKEYRGIYRVEES